MTDVPEKPRLKVVKKPTKKMGAPKPPKPVLKGYVYAFRPSVDEDVFTVEVEKARAGTDKEGIPCVTEATYRVTNDTCDCPAGDHSTPCKHVDMVLGSFRGNEVARETAEDLVEEFLDTFRKKDNDVAVVGSLAFTDRPTVKRADVIVHRAGECAAKIIMFAEYKGLLIRATYLPTEEQFKYEHKSARNAWANKRKIR